MSLIDLTRSCPKVKRKLGKPRSLDPKNIVIAQQYGKEYFDGEREQGYGGYYYDGRWLSVARDIVDHFKLKPGMKVLDIGCAKGFLLKDLQIVCPGIEVYGLDVSLYAILNAEQEVKSQLMQGSATDLPFPDNSFDLVLSINTLHNLERSDLIKSLKEIKRLSSNNSYVQLDAYNTDEDLKIFKQWVLTAKTYLKPKEWVVLFEEAGYLGDYNWTVLDVDREWTNFGDKK